MERGEGPGVWVSWEGVKTLLLEGWAMFSAFFRYIPGFIDNVAGGSWLGAAVVFSIFFAVFLIRSGARSGVANIGAFAGALEHYASWGLLVSGGYLVLFALAWALLPVWTVILTSLVNGLTGGEPGPLQMLAFLATSSEQRDGFVKDMLALYRRGETVLPLSYKAVFMVMVAFGTMWLVARGMGRLRA